MNEKFKIRKVKGADGYVAMEVYDSETNNVLILGKWDIWNLWCNVAR